MALKNESQIVQDAVASVGGAGPIPLSERIYVLVRLMVEDREQRAIKDFLGRAEEFDAATRHVRMECVKLAAAYVPPSASDIVRVTYAAALEQYILTGKTTANDWDAGVLACWQIAHGWDEKCCGEEGVMAGGIAVEIEELFRNKPAEVV